MKRTLRLAALLVVIVVAAAAAIGWHAWRSLDAPLTLRETIRYKVVPGASFVRVADDLAKLGVVPEPRTWALFARLRGFAASVKAGEYEIEPGLTPRSLLAKMVRGDVLLHSFTIVDGWRAVDVLAALRRNPDVQNLLPENPEDLMARLGDPGLAAEGQFLPETYRFESGTTDLELLTRAHAALVRELAAEWAQRADVAPLQTPTELLILASIVEKESAVPQELPKIAGLYLHRLSINMRLQADPTVIYGLGSRYDGTLHTVDLRSDGPYNSYTRTGLPPTPISLPSAAAIRATAHPEATNAIYFVASGQPDGSHVFSATLAEQNEAVARYLALQRRKEAAANP
jgi:UPF0755 protein